MKTFTNLKPTSKRKKINRFRQLSNDHKKKQVQLTLSSKVYGIQGLVPTNQMDGNQCRNVDTE